MIIKKFRIKNYKSIVDSGDCWIEDNLTIFAGKNESGKTSILEALDNFNVERPILEKVIPLKGTDVTPEISITFKMTKDELNQYFQNIKLPNRTKESKDVTIIKTYPNLYNMSNDSADLLELSKPSDGQSLPPLYSEKWAEIFRLIPNFILFRSFEDIIPSEVELTELENNEFIKDLERINKFNISELMDGDFNKFLKLKTSLNINFNKDYAQYWTQDKTSFVFECRGDMFIIRIEEEGEYYEPNQRSQGKQWHIAFYTRVSARASKEKPNVLLIDEPGLFLHASAQKNIYQRLLDSSVESQILFTTHSPYLLNAKELHLVRLVFKNDISRGTEISNKIHAKADKETLTPILTAIGLELNEGIHNFHLSNNVVVEGQSDVFYFNALSKIFQNESYHFIFGGGSSNMGSIGTILTGWGCNVIYLYDNDQGMKDGQKKLMKTWYVKKDLITCISDVSGSIEDLFSKEDFKKFILDDETLSYEETNSEYMKANRIDKVLSSKHFLNKTRNPEINLSQSTIDNFQRIFEILQHKFDRYHELNE